MIPLFYSPLAHPAISLQPGSGKKGVYRSLIDPSSGKHTDQVLKKNQLREEEIVLM